MEGEEKKHKRIKIHHLQCRQSVNNINRCQPEDSNTNIALKNIKVNIKRLSKKLTSIASRERMGQETAGFGLGFFLNNIKQRLDISQVNLKG